ncbi:hypothetical protein [Nocardioides coralli]|uniref:hypothetical protein n=1 Tax=Nocardioides coralli TaxID=2872154 RepID=UPI001CA46AE9|nr:hypothetical protein [Nocardioides coralli]QZY30627.1 hypothetical protein K6T13_08315 [Nocardioides coralli]
MNLGRTASALLCVLLVAGCAGGDPAMEAGKTWLAVVEDARGSDGWSVETLETATTDLPNGAEATGIVDDDGDGRDDDGRVSVTADGEWACVTLPGAGEDGDVASGACS